MTSSKKETKSATVITDYQVLLSGKATFTIESSGKHHTYRIRAVEGDGFDQDPVYFASVLIGPDNGEDFAYLGMVMPRTGEFRLTKASKFPADSDQVKGIAWIVRKFAAGMTCATLPEGVRLLWADQCQRCGRTLTVPSSIDARFGPECVKQVGK